MAITRVGLDRRVVEGVGKSLSAARPSRSNLLASASATSFPSIHHRSATANVNPAAIDRLLRNWRSGEAEAIQASLNDVRLAVQQFPLVPALKKIVSHFASDPEWNRLRPPLVELSESDGRKLISDLETLRFEMPGLST